MKTILTVLIASLMVVGVAQAFNLSTVSVGDTFNQTQVDSKDLSTVGVVFNIDRKEINGDSFDVIFNYRQIVQTKSGYEVVLKTATSSYSVIEYSNCRLVNSVSDCKSKVKTKLKAKIKGYLEAQKEEMRALQTKASRSAYETEMQGLTLTNSDIE